MTRQLSDDVVDHYLQLAGDYWVEAYPLRAIVVYKLLLRADPLRRGGAHGVDRLCPDPLGGHPRAGGAGAGGRSDHPLFFKLRSEPTAHGPRRSRVMPAAVTQARLLGSAASRASAYSLRAASRFPSRAALTPFASR